MIAAKIRKPTRLEKQAYEAITGGKRNYGVYHKSCFHLHTPVSYDYRLLEGWAAKQYEEATAGDLLNLCIDRHVVMPMITLEDIQLEGQFACFETKKQALSFLLLADSIMLADIEIVLIADHNTIQGIDKLKAAIKWVYDTKKYTLYPTVLLGVEISCADRCHVVGIFDDTEVNRSGISEWLDKHLIGVEDGVFSTSIETLDFIEELNGVGYIAHINSSDIWKKGTFSGGYKKKLFGNDRLKYIGISDRTKAKKVTEDLSQFRKTPVRFLIDNDAHTIEAVGENCFWIKGGKCTCSMVLEALNDYHISVEFSLPLSAKQYIKGLYIEKTDNSFLQGKRGGDFCITFSNALNCLIGGRGTGKSSVLEMLEYVINQRCRSERKLDFFCTHGTAWVVYELDGEEYLFEISMPKKQYVDNNILDCFGGPRRIDGRYKYIFRADDVSQHAASHYLHIRKILHEENDWKVQSLEHPELIREKFLDSRYSVNELVNTAGGEEINRFIHDTILKNKAITDPARVASFRKKSGLAKMLDVIETSLKQRATDIDAILQPFNSKMAKELRVTYQQNGYSDVPDFEWLVFGRRVKERSSYEYRNVRESDVVQYLSQLCRVMGPIAFFRMLLNNDIEFAQNTIPIKNFIVEMSVRMIEAGISSIAPEDEGPLIAEIFSRVVREENMAIIQKFFREYLKQNDKFSLHFNVNNREGSNGQPRFMNVRDLSLGQKVVAMLTFILGYSEHSGDYRPLIIDQPEDNLDNQYIYKNLVKQLRDIKERRQVIIATHNATIVTNAKADLVCELQSDNIHGWIEASGYPSEENIKKKILNHLEGGIESFVHKIDIYHNVIS